MWFGRLEGIIMIFLAKFRECTLGIRSIDAFVLTFYFLECLLLLVGILSHFVSSLLVTMDISLLDFLNEFSPRSALVGVCEHIEIATHVFFKCLYEHSSPFHLLGLAMNITMWVSSTIRFLVSDDEIIDWLIHSFLDIIELSSHGIDQDLRRIEEYQKSFGKFVDELDCD